MKISDFRDGRLEIRLPAETKEKFLQVCKSYGLTYSQFLLIQIETAISKFERNNSHGN